MIRNSLTTLGASLRRTLFGAAAFALLSFTAAGAAHADWRFSVTPYAWLTDVGVDVELDGREVVDETIPVGDLVKILDTILQMKLEAQNGEFGVMVDLFDVTMSDEASGIALPQGAGEAATKSDMGMTIFDLAAVYDPQGDHQGFAFLGGTRILNERATIDATLRATSGGTAELSYETNDTMVDGLIGVRFTKRFSRQWAYQMQADVSTGGTDYTWSVAPSLTYAFGKLGRYGLDAGYRRMAVDFQDEAGIDTQMTLSGFLLGLRTSF